MTLPTSLITSYHAHIYYSEDTKAKAQSLSKAVEETYEGAEFGRWHDRPVGPHPDWSHQIAFEPRLFDQVIPFLALNQGGLTIFIHPNTDDELRDHRDGAIWIGQTRPLDLSIFDES